jgi:hypothetical protein
MRSANPSWRFLPQPPLKEGGEQMLMTISAVRLSGLVATDVISMLRCLATGLARSVGKSAREQWINVPSTIWPQKWSCAPVPPCPTSDTTYSWYVVAFGGVSGFSVSSTHRVLHRPRRHSQLQAMSKYDEGVVILSRGCIDSEDNPHISTAYHCKYYSRR